MALKVLVTSQRMAKQTDYEDLQKKERRPHTLSPHGKPFLRSGEYKRQLPMCVSNVPPGGNRTSKGALSIAGHLLPPTSYERLSFYTIQLEISEHSLKISHLENKEATKLTLWKLFKS